MLKKSQHTVIVLDAIEEDQIDLDCDLININNSKISNTVNPFTTMCNQSMMTLMKRLINTKSMYYQSTKNNKTTIRELDFIEFNNYEKNEFIPEYKGELTLQRFKELLINNESVVFDKKEADAIQQYFDNINLNNNAIFNIEFISSKGLMKLVKKSIEKRKDNVLIPYFNEKTSSFSKNQKIFSFLGRIILFLKITITHTLKLIITVNLVFKSIQQ